MSERTLGDMELSRTRAELPETALVTDYTMGLLSPEETLAFERRLGDDAAFAAHARPILDATRAAHGPIEISAAEVEQAWVRFVRTTQTPKAPPPPAAPAIALSTVRRWQLAAGLLLALLPGVAWLAFSIGPRLGGPGVYEEVVAEPGGRTIDIGKGGTIRLAAGARLFRPAIGNRAGATTFTLHAGSALFALPSLSRGAYHVLTPSGRVVVTGTEFQVDVVDPQLTRVTVYEGAVRLESIGPALHPPVDLMPKEGGLMVYNQPPRRR